MKLIRRGAGRISKVALNQVYARPIVEISNSHSSGLVRRWCMPSIVVFEITTIHFPILVEEAVWASNIYEWYLCVMVVEFRAVRCGATVGWVVAASGALQ